jgi:hypothetical protein
VSALDAGHSVGTECGSQGPRDRCYFGFLCCWLSHSVWEAVTLAGRGQQLHPPIFLLETKSGVSTVFKGVSKNLQLPDSTAQGYP